MPFHVFVEGAQDASPAGVRKLAHAMSQRFGLPAADLETRIASGRFRVKANVERDTADSLAHALETLGARVVIEDAAAAPARPSGSSLPPANRPHSGNLPAAPRTTTGDRTAASKLQSGLAAAFTSERAQSEGDFRLLAGESLSLASLDGNDAGTASAEDKFSPPPPAAPPPPVAAPRTTTAQGAKQAPVDLFRPPEADDDDLAVDVAAEELAEKAEKAERARQGSLPPAHGAPATTGPLPPAMRYSAKVEPAPVTTVKEPMPRGRFAAGVLLCVILGFLPAHVIAGGHQRDEYAAIDAQVNATQAAAVSDEDAYRSLDTFRATQLANKQSAKRMSIIMALGIWVVAAGIVGFIYFTRIPWDTLGARKQDSTAAG